MGDDGNHEDGSKKGNGAWKEKGADKEKEQGKGKRHPRLTLKPSLPRPATRTGTNKRTSLSKPTPRPEFTLHNYPSLERKSATSLRLPKSPIVVLNVSPSPKKAAVTSIRSMKRSTVTSEGYPPLPSNASKRVPITSLRSSKIPAVAKGKDTEHDYHAGASSKKPEALNAPSVEFPKRRKVQGSLSSEWELVYTRPTVAPGSLSIHTSDAPQDRRQCESFSSSEDSPISSQLNFLKRFESSKTLRNSKALSPRLILDLARQEEKQGLPSYGTETETKNARTVLPLLDRRLESLSGPKGLPCYVANEELSNEKLPNPQGKTSAMVPRYFQHPHRLKGSVESMESVSWDPAVIESGPLASRTSLDRNESLEVRNPHVKSGSEESRAVLEDRLQRFTRSIKELKRRDRRVIERLLEALKNVESDDESTVFSDKSKAIQAKHNKSAFLHVNNPSLTKREMQSQPAATHTAMRGLNPQAPEFRMDGPKMLVGEQKKFPRRSNTRRTYSVDELIEHGNRMHYMRAPPPPMQLLHATNIEGVFPYTAKDRAGSNKYVPPALRPNGGGLLVPVNVLPGSNVSVPCEVPVPSQRADFLRFPTQHAACQQEEIAQQDTLTDNVWSELALPPKSKEKQQVSPHRPVEKQSRFAPKHEVRKEEAPRGSVPLCPENNWAETLFGEKDGSQHIALPKEFKIPAAPAANDFQNSVSAKWLLNLPIGQQEDRSPSIPEIPHEQKQDNRQIPLIPPGFEPIYGQHNEFQRPVMPPTWQPLWPSPMSGLPWPLMGYPQSWPNLGYGPMHHLPLPPVDLFWPCPPPGLQLPTHIVPPIDPALTVSPPRETGSNRAAVPLDPVWGTKVLNDFKNKYPMTGDPDSAFPDTATQASNCGSFARETQAAIAPKVPYSRTGDQRRPRHVPVMPIVRPYVSKKKLEATGIQQRLEMLILEQKERKAYDVLTRTSGDRSVRRSLQRSSDATIRITRRGPDRYSGQMYEAGSGKPDATFGKNSRKVPGTESIVDSQALED